MIFTTFFALVPDRAWPMLERAVKVQVGTLLALMLLYRKDHVLALIWVIAGSIGFYAIKGGIFTIATLGQYRVWGPDDSFIADNNAFALATVMSIPLWAYLYTQYQGAAVDSAWRDFARSLLSAVSAIGSHSRGAVVAIVAMAVFLWLKSRKKLALGTLIVIAAIGAGRLHAPGVGGSHLHHHRPAGRAVRQQSPRNLDHAVEPGRRPPLYRRRI